MKILFNFRMKDEEFKKIEELGYEIICIPEANIKNTEKTDDADILVCYNPFATLDISKMKNLKYIILTSIGFDQLPKDKILQQNIQVSNYRGGYSIPIAEWIVMCILTIYKKSRDFYEKQNKKIWKMDFSITELYGQKVGFLGTGTIASEAAKRLKGFGVEIWGCNTNGRSIEYFDKCIKKDDMEEIFENCDIVVNTMPCTPKTEGILNEDKFKLMKEGSSFINIGRGKSVKEDDLIKYLDKFKGVALDVFEEEPLSKDSYLWEAENVIVTPHSCWISDKNEIRRFESIYSNLKKYKQGKKVSNLIDIKRGY